MELLLKKGAAIDALNNGECSTLHVAVNKQHLDCVRVLLQHKANVNIQVCISRSGNILSFLLPLFQEGQLSVTGESMCTKYWLTA